MTAAFTLLALAGPASLVMAQSTTPPASQNPSPMVEYTRAHQRLTPRALGGITRSFAGPAGKPVELWIPDRVRANGDFDLVVHFLGAAWLPEQAVADLGNNTVAAVVNLGPGTGVYDRAFTDPAVFDSLLAGATREVSTAIGKRARLGRVTLVGFSAGHGAVRAILRDPHHFARVDAVLLLDGMHTSYIPDRTVLAAGGTLDTTNLVGFAEFARAAMRGEKRFLVTHSEIFPGTFASTTETADWLLHALGLRRTPVVRWGPRGMQQLSEVRAGRFELMGFAGNSAPDHIDQLHAMPEMLARLLAPGTATVAGAPPVTSHAAGGACYRADRALGTSAASASGRAVPGLAGRRIGEDSAGLATLTTFQLLDGGHVDRPGTVGRSWWAAGSRWDRAGDTLHVRLSTTTSGWDLRLVPVSGTEDTLYTGMATYLTDVVVKDTGAGAWRPPQVPIRVRREPCSESHTTM